MKAYEQTNNNQEDCVDATSLNLMHCYTWVILTRTYNQNMQSLGQRPQRWDNFPQREPQHELVKMDFLTKA